MSHRYTEVLLDYKYAVCNFVRKQKCSGEEKMPEVLCRILDRKVDGGYCAFVCELPEMEKKIVFNPVRGIYTGCRFSTEDIDKSPIVSWKIERLTVGNAVIEKRNR